MQSEDCKTVVDEKLSLSANKLIQFVDLLYEIDIDSEESKTNEIWMQTEKGFVYYNFLLKFTQKSNPRVYKNFMEFQKLIKHWLCSANKHEIKDKFKSLQLLKELNEDKKPDTTMLRLAREIIRSLK